MEVRDLGNLLKASQVLRLRLRQGEEGQAKGRGEGLEGSGHCD